MKIIKPSVEFFGAVPTDYDNALKFIELAGRTCYRSEGKIKEGSAEKFVKSLLRPNPPHLAMVEHSNFVVRLDSARSLSELLIQTGKFLNVVVANECTYVGGSITAWAQQCALYETPEFMFDPFIYRYGKLFGLNDPAPWESSWEQCPHAEIPAELHRYSAKFICDRGVSHEIVRHRPCSFAQESTRYVNYSGKDMEFIEPAGYEGWSPLAHDFFRLSCGDAARRYKFLVNCGGLKPQQARAVLPNALRTEIVVTADAKEWAHIRKLRTHKSAHPDIVRAMELMPWGEFLDGWEGINQNKCRSSSNSCYSNYM
jgi:thymidylate synthase (FAD)